MQEQNERTISSVTNTPVWTTRELPRRLQNGKIVDVFVISRVLFKFIYIIALRCVNYNSDYFYYRELKTTCYAEISIFMRHFHVKYIVINILALRFKL